MPMPKTSCCNCPFRKDGLKGLHPERITDIVESITDDEYFTCHKTRSTVCIGSLNFTHTILGDQAFDLGHLRSAERLGIWDPSLEPSDTFYQSVGGMINEHQTFNQP